MGLDMYCNEINCHLTYSGFQRVRMDLLVATLKYIENNKDKMKEYYIKNYIKDEDDYESLESYINIKIKETEQYIKELITPKRGDENYIQFMMFNILNYTRINHNDNDLLKMFGIYGIIPIINHSDCEGFYTSHEAGDFMEVLKKIYMYISRDYFYNGENILEEYYLYDIMNESISTLKPIRLS